MLEISRATLYRRLSEAGISPHDRTELSNEELDDLMRSIKHDHPNDGEVLIKGHLIRLGIRVPRQAIRDSIHRVDHINRVARRRFVVRRRVYSVPYPNFAWHIDGHHKLIPWRFVIHGAIDGFSRTVIFLKCSDNNRASTVLNLFREGVSHFGLPEHVRSDHGGENVDVWRFMIATHNFNHSCVITGSSVHNERVERLWRDVNRCICSCFADTFRSLESGVLDPLNEVDLWCLHYIFSPRINKCLSEFKESWNNHALSSEGSKTPYQLFFEGVNCAGIEYTSADVDLDLSELAGERVVVLRISMVPCRNFQHSLLCVDPLQPCSDNGVALYTRALEIAGQHLSEQCGECFQL